MRAAIVGVFFRDDPERRIAFGRALAEVTHRDPRAVEGALFVAELAAFCAAERAGADRTLLVERARAVVVEPTLALAIGRALELASGGGSGEEAAKALGTSGFVIHTVGFATWCFLRHGSDPHLPIVEAIRAGGDTDTIAAIVGGWTGALHGGPALRADLLGKIHDGPFGPTHLRALAQALADRRAGRATTVPQYSPLAALVRNLALYPVILYHGLRRLIRFWP
jgi:ADP-ribosylglycohydrolase